MDPFENFKKFPNIFFMDIYETFKKLPKCFFLINWIKETYVIV